MARARDRSEPSCRSRREVERGFTIIELVVAMVLLILAFGMVASGVIAAFQGSGMGRAGVVSDAAIARATSALSDDVAQAETQGRADGLLRDPIDLAKAISTGGSPASSDVATPGPVDIDDVVLAEPRRLHLRVDADPVAPGVECVEWAAASAGGRFEIVRTVRTCGASSTLSRRVMLSAQDSAPGLQRDPFSYELLCAPARCGAASKATAAAACRPWTSSAAVSDPKMRRWIVGVHASFTTVTAEGRAATGAKGSIEMAIRSRDTEFYRAALGC